MTGETPRKVNQSMVHWGAAGRFLLDYAKRSGRPQFRRVSQRQIEPHLNAILRKAMRDIVDSHPSMGVTLKLYTDKR